MRRRSTRSFLTCVLGAFHSLLIHWIDRVALLLVPGKPPESGSTKKVLVIRLDAIGDFILWLDAAKGIRTLFPADRYRITLLGNAIWTPLAENLPVFDEVVALDRNAFVSDPVYRRKLLARVRRSGFDVAIHPTFSREFRFGDSVVRFCGARERIGYEGDCSNILPFLRRISDGWYTRLVPASGKRLMELQRNAEFLRVLGLSDFRSSVPELSGFDLPLPASGRSHYYVLFPGAGAPIRKWPVERFSALAGRVYNATGWTGIVCGGPGEEEIGDTLVRSSVAPLENRSGRTSLSELVAIIGDARLIVANETGAIHIAAAVSTPSVCILGGGHHGRFLPYTVESPTGRPLPITVTHPMDCYHCDWACIHDPKQDEPAPCVGNISVDDVWRTVQQILTRMSIAPSEPNGRFAECPPHRKGQEP